MVLIFNTMKVFTPVVRQYTLVVTANLAILTTGMSIAWPSPSLIKLQNPIDSPLSRPITVEEGSWIVSSGYLLASVTCILGGMLIDIVGRKNCILLATIPKCCLALFLIFANEVWMFIFCRAVMIAIDTFLLIVVPIYASEIASEDHRGALGTLLQLLSSMGVLFCLAVGPFLPYVTFSIVYAGILAVASVPLLFLPETPFHMYSKGRLDEAMKILRTIRNSEIQAKQELEDYITFSKETKKAIEKSALLKNKTFLKALSLSILLCVGTQLIGINGVNNYLQTIMEASHTSLPSEVGSVIVGAIQILTCVCTTLIMNTFGRRTILLMSLIGYFIGMLGLGTFFKITEDESYVVAGLMNYLPIVSLVVIIIFYNIGIGTLIWIIPSELFDGPSRATGVTITITISIIMVFVTAKSFALMTTALGSATTYFFFCSMSVLIFVIIAIFLPETKGKTFGEIQIALGEKIETINEKNDV